MKSEITLPTDMLERFIVDEQKNLELYREWGNTEMEYFAKGRIAVYQTLLEIWAK